MMQCLYGLTAGSPGLARYRVTVPAPPSFISGVKRLLAADLAWARAHPKALESYGMAFYDELPAGTGTDTNYSLWRVFNLAVALEIVRFGGRQDEVVDLISQIQLKLKSAFAKSVRATHPEKFDNYSKNKPENSSLCNNVAVVDREIYLILRRVEIAADNQKILGNQFAVGDILYDHWVLEGRSALNFYLNEQNQTVILAMLVINLTDIAVTTYDLLQLVPARNRGRPSLRLTPQQLPENIKQVITEIRVRRFDREQ